jgi:hypothetical protein
VRRNTTPPRAPRAQRFNTESGSADVRASLRTWDQPSGLLISGEAHRPVTIGVRPDRSVAMLEGGHRDLEPPAEERVVALSVVMSSQV